MSRVGKSPIKVPSGVKINISGQTVNVEGPKGKMSFNLNERVTFTKEGEEVVLKRASESKTDKALHGTSRAILNNMVTGVTKGFTKELEIRGVGYRGEQKGKSVSLLLGYSHPIVYNPPAGINVKMDGNVKVIVEGIDRQAVGQVAATIRGFKPPEPYKGKGVRYMNEVVVQKEVKKS
jgi:large subunit ribosomal protein L6